MFRTTRQGLLWLFVALCVSLSGWVIAFSRHATTGAHIIGWTCGLLGTIMFGLIASAFVRGDHT